MADQQLEIRWVGELQRCDVRPGDKFVLNVDGIISDHTAQHIQRAWKDFIGGDHAKLLILTDGMKLGVFGQAEAA